MAATSLLQLSQSRQTLVRLCQATNFGSIQDLIVEAGEPVFAASRSTVLQEVKLDAEDQGRSEAALPDFVLCAEFTRLLAVLDRIGSGKISGIEIRGGLPRRVVIERPVSEYLAPLSAGREEFEVACREAGRI